MKFLAPALACLLALALAACAALNTTQTEEPFRSPTPAATQTATASPTAHQTPTPPNPPPVLPPTPTPVPWSAAEINAASAARVEELASWGLGRAGAMQTVLDGAYSLVLSYSGAFLYQREPFALLWRAPEATSFAFPPDEQRVAVLLPDGKVDLLKTDTGTPVCRYAPPDGMQVFNLQFNQDGTRLAVGYQDTSITLISMPDCQALTSLSSQYAGRPYQMAFSPDGRLFASTGLNEFYQDVLIWDVETGQALRLIPKAGAISPAAFTPDGETLAAARGLSILLWDTTDGSLLKTVSVGTYVSSVEVWEDGLRLEADLGARVQVRSLESGTLLETREPEPAPPGLTPPELLEVGFYSGLRSAVFSPDGGILAWGIHASPYFLQFPSGRSILLDQQVTEDIAFAVSADGGRYAFCFAGSLWAGEAPGFSPGILSTCEDDAPLAASAERIARPAGQGVDVLDPATGDLLNRLGGLGLPAFSLAFSPDGRYLAAGAEYHDLEAWSLDPALGVLGVHDIPMMAHALAFSADDSLLAFSYGTGRGLPVRIVHLPTGATLKYLLKHEPSGAVLQAKALAFSPDGSLLAVGEMDGNIYLYDTTTWEVLATLQGHAQAVLSLSFSPEGRDLLSASADGTLRLWGLKRP